MSDAYFLGIDVGTASVRVGVFDESGTRVGMGVEPIEVSRPAEDLVEQSSDDIWRACGVAVRAALASAKLGSKQIAGIGFDATCSLVVLGEGDAPVSVSPTGDDHWNVVVWMDHRAVDQARRINEGGHEVLRYVGGVISPEMQTPKLLWLKERSPATWSRARRFLDLPDFLSYRATCDDTRSLCTTVCKWTYLGHSGGWQETYFRSVGLGDLADEQFSRVGSKVLPVGEKAGVLTEGAARDLGLEPGTAVAISLIDAHAGGLGVLGFDRDGVAPTQEELERRLALIGGTSTCHMAVSREAKYVPGVWGPYYSAMVPGMWLTEGGQSATGALIDHTIFSHCRGAALKARAAEQGKTVYELLNERLDVLAASAAFVAELTRELHVLPDHHGNRSPRADPSLRGMVSGLRLSDSVDSLALLYLATIQALAYGTRHVLEAMNSHGHRIDTLVATGGDAKNPVFLREHADATGCKIVLPREREAVLLGSAMLGAAASGRKASVFEAMRAMSGTSRELDPAGGNVRSYHDAKYKVFLRMYDDQMAYRRLMSGA